MADVRHYDAWNVHGRRSQLSTLRSKLRVVLEIHGSQENYTKKSIDTYILWLSELPSTQGCYSYNAFCTRFLNNKSDIEKVWNWFMGLWSSENENIVSDAIESPELFVLKPQREGGGMPSISQCSRNVWLQMINAQPWYSFQGTAFLEIICVRRWFACGRIEAMILQHTS
jgi:hypothetical protein